MNTESAMDDFQLQLNSRSKVEYLSKREYFAVMILQGLITKDNLYVQPMERVKEAIEFADELLKQLE